MVGFIVTNRDIQKLLGDIDARTSAALTGVADAVAHLSRRIYRMSVDVSKLGPAIQAVKDDVAKVGTDVQSVIDKLNGINGVDPAVQAVVDQAVADLGGVKDNLDAIDSKATAASA